MYYLLMVYREREGAVDVPVNHVENGWQLGSWLGEQRALYKRNILDPTHQERLEEAGVAWNLNDRNWETMLALLAAFNEREGHVVVPQRHQEKGKNLGTWLHTQRVRQKNGDLAPERQRKLEDLGVAWHPQQAKWERMCSLLEKFKQREDHAQIPISHREDGEKLGTWLSNQRKALQKGELSKERQERLEDLGVDLDSRSAAWTKMVKILADFIEREGHSNVPQAHQEQGKNLGVWWNDRRCEKRKGKLSMERLQQLEALGVSWNVRWESMYEILVEYQRREGHVLVPRKHEEAGENLGTWLAHQRHAMKCGSMSAKRQNQLTSLGVTLPRRKAGWERMYSLLIQFQKREGHVLVRRRHEEGGEQLGEWLARQRQATKKGSLSPERQQQLEEVGVVLPEIKETV